MRLLYSKAAELSELVAIVSSEQGIQQHLEPDELGAFGGHDGWTAWHPRQEHFEDNPLWAGLVPVIYLHQEKGTSVIVPVDWEHLLAWKLPQGSILLGKLLPISPRFSAKNLHELRGCEGWSVVQADMDDKI